MATRQGAVTWLAPTGRDTSQYGVTPAQHKSLGILPKLARMLPSAAPHVVRPMHLAATVAAPAPFAFLRDRLAQRLEPTLADLAAPSSNRWYSIAMASQMRGAGPWLVGIAAVLKLLNISF